MWLVQAIGRSRLYWLQFEDVIKEPENEPESKPEKQTNLVAWLGFAGAIVAAISTIMVAAINASKQGNPELTIDHTPTKVPTLSPVISNSTAVTPLQAMPTPSPRAALTLEDKQRLWNVVIYLAKHSRLMESYVPDQLRDVPLGTAIADVELLSLQVQSFEKIVNDSILGSWLTSIKYNLERIQERLKNLNSYTMRNYTALSSAGLLTMQPAKRFNLQIAEYSRVQLLGDLAQVSKELKMDDPGFPKSAAKAVPGVSPSDINEN